MKDGWRIRPGAVFERMLDMYDPTLTVKHVMFTAPIQWKPDLINEVNLPSKTIYPLLAIPITDEESEYVRAHGDVALEQLWEARCVDVFDWHRGAGT